MAAAAGPVDSKVDDFRKKLEKDTGVSMAASDPLKSPPENNLVQRIADLELQLEELNLKIKSISRIEPLGFPSHLLGNDERTTEKVFMAALEGGIRSIPLGLNGKMLESSLDRAIFNAEEMVKRWLHRRSSSRVVEGTSKKKG